MGKNSINYKKFDRLVRQQWKSPERRFVNRLYNEFLALKGKYNVVLGYGSLLNSKSAMKSLYGAKDLGFDYLKDHKRVFNMGHGNGGYLNVEYSKGDKVVVRKWQITGNRQLAQYIIREANYEFVRTNDGRLFCISPSWGTDILPNKNYFDVCIAELEGEYLENFLTTTYNADGKLTRNYFNL